jgi:hypothetical protein
MQPPDRMAAFEAPRLPERGRVMRDVELRFRGRRPEGSRSTVQIPKEISLPDVIRYRGHTFVRRASGNYEEATMWPILDELDGA